MGASLAVILANLWLKEYEFALRQQIPGGTGVQQINDGNGLCPCCSRKVTYRSKGVECESCRNWYHLKCGKISDDVYASITEIVWYCESCCQAKNKEKDTPQVKFSSGMWMTFLEQSEGSRVVFSMPPILFIQICSSL